jgi:hypothetical protein
LKLYRESELGRSEDEDVDRQTAGRRYRHAGK